MHLLTLGLNHRTAAVDLRERTAFSPEQLPDAVRSLTASSDIAEATILSTCNRTEIYCRQENPASAPVLDWLRDYGDLPSDVLNSSTYALPGEQAVQGGSHLTRIGPVIRRSCIDFPLRADEGPLFDARNVARVASCQE